MEKQRKMFLVTVLDSAQRATLEDGELFVEFSPESRHFRDTLIKAENIKILRDACLEVTGKETGVRIVIEDPNANDGQSNSRDDEERAKKQQLRDSAETSPITQQLLKTFRGEITDVRRD